MTEIQKDTTLTLEQKQAKRDVEVAKLINAFQGRRRAEYEAVAVQRSVGHSCTSKTRGGRKNCGWQCVGNPAGGLYTRDDWVIVAGDNKGTHTQGGKQACLRMTVAGKGRNAGTLTATFRYEPSHVAAMLKQESAWLLNEAQSA